MQDDEEPITAATIHRRALAWLRADPRRLLAALLVAMALPLALLLPLAPRVDEGVLPPLPPLEITPLPDFTRIDDVTTKKAAFFGYLLPMIEAHNARLRVLRAELEAIRGRLAAGETLEPETAADVRALKTRYRVPLPEDEPLDVAALDRLLRRVDVLPPSLVLAQAATESAWGTSRFARRANNLFGEWCFTEGCGLVPARRAEGARHEVEEFDSVYASIDSYFRNLNSHPAYAGVRARRAEARRSGAAIRGAELAAGLTRYSERGQAYVDELRAIMRVNDLDEYDLLPGARTALAGP